MLVKRISKQFFLLAFLQMGALWAYDKKAFERDVIKANEKFNSDTFILGGAFAAKFKDLSSINGYLSHLADAVSSNSELAQFKADVNEAQGWVAARQKIIRDEIKRSRVLDLQRNLQVTTNRLAAESFSQEILYAYKHALLRLGRTANDLVWLSTNIGPDTLLKNGSTLSSYGLQPNVTRARGFDSELIHSSFLEYAAGFLDGAKALMSMRESHEDRMRSLIWLYSPENQAKLTQELAKSAVPAVWYRAFLAMSNYAETGFAAKALYPTSKTQMNVALIDALTNFFREYGLFSLRGSPHSIKKLYAPESFVKSYESLLAVLNAELGETMKVIAQSGLSVEAAAKPTGLLAKMACIDGECQGTVDILHVQRQKIVQLNQFIEKRKAEFEQVVTALPECTINDVARSPRNYQAVINFFLTNDF